MGTFSACGQVSENLHGDASAVGKASSKSRAPISFRTLLILVLVWVVSAVYAGIHLKRGWIPHDEGSFAQSAERVMQGQLPHRDFDEVYTGGLTFANALAFRELGVNLTSLRIVLFMFFLAWVPVVYYVASRFLSAYAAGGLTLLAVAYSIPNYPAPVASWYNLFFAVFGVAALLRYIETRARCWLVAAGFCGGLSIVVKISGLYFVAATLMFFVYRAQALSRAEKDESRERHSVYSVAIALGLAIFLGSLVKIILEVPGLNQVVNFVLPSVALCAVLARREWNGSSVEAGARFAALFEMAIFFSAGVTVPVAIFLVPYARSGAVEALIRGVFILPARRLGYAMLPTPSLVALLAVLPVVAVLVVAYCSHRTIQYLLGGVLVLVFGFVLWYSGQNAAAYRFSWHSIAASIPVVVLTGAVILGIPRFERRLSCERQQQLMVLLCSLALTTLFQFPFSAQIYFCYTAPMLMLAGAGTLASIRRPPHLVLTVVMLFYGFFAVWRATPGFVYHIGNAYAPDEQTEVSSLGRAGGLRGDPARVGVYERLIPLLQAHASGQFIYAAPDCPEVYFLAGLKNPTRTMFDFFDEPTGHEERILNAIESHNVKVVAINQEPPFSLEINDAVDEVLEARFPYSKRVENFEVRWRD